MIAFLFQLAKRRNSTLRPLTEPGNVFIQTEVVLKDATSVLYPTISVSSNLSAYNYIQLPELGNRYYFIENWTCDLGRWWAECSIDVLATYRTAVYTYNGYVLRSYSRPVNTIIDELAPKYTAVQTVKQDIATPWIANLNAGVYVCGIVNDDVNSLGSVSYYVLTQPQLNALKQYMMQNVNYVSSDWATVGISQDLLKALFNPLQYIVSCMFFPIQGFGGTTDVDNLKCGWWSTPVSGKQIIPTAYGLQIANITVPKHPQAAANNNFAYLKSSGYSRYILHFPPFEDILLDSEMLLDVTAIDIQLLLDPGTGLGSLKVTPHNDTLVLAYTETQIGVPLALAQMSTDLSNLKMAAGATLAAQAANMLTKSSALSFLGDFKETGERIVSGIGEIATAGTTKMLSSGSNGSLAAYFNCTPQLQAVFTRVLSPKPEVMGYPTCESVVLSQLTGYALLYKPDVAIPAPGTAAEADMINNLLATGIFCEWT